MKKIIEIVLILTIVLSLCACGTQKSSPVEDFEYEFEDGSVVITGYTGSDLEIVIPDSIENRPVTVIGKEAFEEYDMKSVVIPESVIEIQDSAFNCCRSLEEITTSSTLQIVASNAFESTLWIEKQPEGILYLNKIVIGNKGGGDYPMELYIEDGTVAIVDNALQVSKYASSIYSSANKSEYKSIHIPESVKYIGEESVGYNDYDTIGTTRMKNFTIYGKAGSVANTYANENEFNFIEE